MTDVWALYEQLLSPADWEADAACAGMDTELFYPPRHHDGSDALAVCRRCPVAQGCLDEAMGGRFMSREMSPGIWGGTTPNQRHAMRSGRLRQVANPPQGVNVERKVQRRLQPDRDERGQQTRCGTQAGYDHHRWRRERACRACVDAHAAYERSRVQERGAA